MRKIHNSTIGHEKSQVLLIFGELIMNLHVLNIHLEISALDQQPAIKKVQILLISCEIIMTLS